MTDRLNSIATEYRSLNKIDDRYLVNVAVGCLIPWKSRFSEDVQYLNAFFEMVVVYKERFEWIISSGHGGTTFATHMKKEHARDIIKLDLEFDKVEMSIHTFLSVRQAAHEKVIDLCTKILANEPPIDNLLE